MSETMLRRRARLASEPSAFVAGLAAALALSACTSGNGTLLVLIQAEEAIAEGLVPGSDVENIQDGWSVTFDTYAVAVGRIEIGISAADRTAMSSDVEVTDLTTISPGGDEFARLAGLEPRRYGFFGYATPAAADGTRHSSVSQPDYDAMAAVGATYLLEGRLEKDGGQSCPPRQPCRDRARVAFSLLIPAVTTYGACSVDGISGVIINSGVTTAVGITVHGDHLFFSAFPGGAEVVERRAQWLADSDTNGDGQVNMEELATIRGYDLSFLFPSARYQLGSWSAFPINSAADFARAQMHGVGHFQGEGECLPLVGEEGPGESGDAGG